MRRHLRISLASLRKSHNISSIPQDSRGIREVRVIPMPLQLSTREYWITLLRVAQRKHAIIPAVSLPADRTEWAAP